MFHYIIRIFSLLFFLLSFGSFLFFLVSPVAVAVAIDVVDNGFSVSGQRDVSSGEKLNETAKQVREMPWRTERRPASVSNGSRHFVEKAPHTTRLS